MSIPTEKENEKPGYIRKALEFHNFISFSNTDAKISSFVFITKFWTELLQYKGGRVMMNITRIRLVVKYIPYPQIFYQPN